MRELSVRLWRTAGSDTVQIASELRSTWAEVQIDGDVTP